MEHVNSTTPTTAAERNFLEFMQRGDDFFQIELFRFARSWYNKALALKPETERAKHQIAECDRLLQFERKVRLILVAVALSIIAVYYFVLQ